MPLPTIPSTNPTTIPARPELPTRDAFGYLLHFFVSPPWDGAWGLQLKAANWDAATGTFAPLDDARTPPDQRNQHGANFTDLRPLIAPTLQDGTPNPKFLPALAQTMGAVLVMFPLAIQYQQAELALAAANALPEKDATKANQVAAAQAAYDAARAALGAS